LIDGRAILRKPLFIKENSMQRRNFITLSLLPLTLAMAQAAAAYPEYRVTIVGPVDSQANDINNAGVVVGTYPISPTATRSFLNRGAGYVSLSLLGGTSSEAVAINDRGQVLGNRTTTSGPQRGFIYYHGAYRDIGVIPGRLTRFKDINNAGYILALGTSSDPLVPPLLSYLRSPGGTYRNIGTLPFENPVTQAEALNNRNQITGESGPLLLPDPPLRAFLWTSGVMRDLGDFGFAPNYGLAINDHGTVTGYAAVPTGFRNQVAFIYRKGRLIDIDRRPATADRFSQGDGINNYGHVVGYSNHLSGFIYRGRCMESLNALIDPKGGWDIRFPRAINDKGQIAATAVRGGRQYAVRLDPIRPGAEVAQELTLDEEAGPIVRSGLTPGQEEAEAKVEAEAAAKEAVKPLGQ
jgi:uncharacterized membrane protein